MSFRHIAVSCPKVAIAALMSFSLSCTDSPITSEPSEVPNVRTIVLDDQGWLPFDPMKSGREPGENSTYGPKFEFDHPRRVITPDRKIKVGVSIFPNHETSAPLELTSLHVVAEKEIKFLGKKQKDITNDVLEVLDRGKCDGLLCQSLKINEAIELRYGKGTYTFVIGVSDTNGNTSTQEFEIVRT